MVSFLRLKNHDAQPSRHHPNLLLHGIERLSSPLCFGIGDRAATARTGEAPITSKRAVKGSMCNGASAAVSLDSLASLAWEAYRIRENKSVAR